MNFENRHWKKLKKYFQNISESTICKKHYSETGTINDSRVSEDGDMLQKVIFLNNNGN